MPWGYLVCLHPRIWARAYVDSDRYPLLVFVLSMLVTVGMKECANS